MDLSPQDRKQLAARGIPPERLERQLQQLRAGSSWLRLERPCTAGDGILQLTGADRSALGKSFSEAAAEGRLSRFVPASGAATRMFKPLYEAKAEDLAHFSTEIEKFAFYPELKESLAAAGQNLAELLAAGATDTVIRHLLEPHGLGYAGLPKGLLPFHAAVDGLRTPFIEHQAEAALLSGLDADLSLHFTVSPEHLELFQGQAAAWRSTLEETYGCHFELGYSTQQPATDTPALDEDGAPLRGDDGSLQLRPGGHGALIENLNALSGDIVLVRNIDNVVPDAHKGPNLEWTRLMTGMLLQLQREQHFVLKALHRQPDDPIARELAYAFLCDCLQLELPLDLDGPTLCERLDRPLRVCGMVPNSGEPGGGPFWVRDASGRLSRQIVEGAQIDDNDPEQAAILAAATHFNPVDMACALRDWRGQPYDLHRFVDEDAVIITEKSQQGQKVRALELPGLWNGAMAGWHTLFVELPPECFNPVKTVFDLLRPAHQG